MQIARAACTVERKKSQKVYFLIQILKNPQSKTTRDVNPELTPTGPVGSYFIRIKVITDYRGSSCCISVRKVYVELPREGKLVFTQSEGVGNTLTGIFNYVEITLFERSEDGIEDCGMVRFQTKNGFDITNNGELIARISTKTDRQEGIGPQIVGDLETILREENFVLRNSNPSDCLDAWNARCRSGEELGV